MMDTNVNAPAKPAKQPRVGAREVDPMERIRGFGEVDRGYTTADAVLEASRCLRCRKPSCVAACPVGVDIPGFIARICEGDLKGGLEVIKGANLLPSVCGRVCPQETQCEGSCVLGRKSSPVAIGQLERFLGDKAPLFENSAAHGLLWEDPEASDLLKVAQGFWDTPTGDEVAPELGKVAVIGSGPAGIACASELARAGAQVTMFDSLYRLGGVLVYGIPEFRLPKDVVARELDGLEALGVKVERDCVVGCTVTIDELLEGEGFDAAFIGVGAGLPKMLRVPGENLSGVVCANEYLTRVNLLKAYEFPKSATPVRRAHDVVVFGGGNVAMDAARTAVRLGAESVTLAYRRTENEMPARRAEVEHAKAEGVKVMELVSPLGFEADDSGFVRAARVRRMELGEPDASGRRRPVPMEGPDSIVEVPCDLAITAIGTDAGPLVPLMARDLELNQWGYIVADGDGHTSDARIWAGGDIVTGAATVISAMGAGKRAAASIIEALRG